MHIGYQAKPMRQSLRFAAEASAQLGPLGIPIDHLLHSAELQIVDRRTGPDVGSDHRGLVVDIAPVP